jgi:biopolymer transport protein ExbD
MAAAAAARTDGRALYRKLKRRIPEPEDVTFLNITAMMDMMTIILVFFLKNFSVSTSNVNISDELRLPGSTTQIGAHQAVAITVTTRAILVEDEQVAAVKGGAVDASIKRDGEHGYFITPLYDELSRHATRLKLIEQRSGSRQPFSGEMTVLADRGTPYRLLSEVLYTAGQAEFSRYRLVVIQREAKP